MPAGRRSVRRAYARTGGWGGASLQRRIEESPYCLGNSSGPLAVTNWDSKLTCVCQVSARRRGVRRTYARARAGGEFCTLQNRKVAMLPCKLKWPLNGGRVGFQVNSDFQMSARRHSLRRARGDGLLRIVQNIIVAMLPWKFKWPLRGIRLDFQVNARVLLQDVCQTAQRTPRVCARVWSCAWCRLEKSPCCPGH